ncbi:pyridoxamine 5'-phosphate oxidase family protein [Maritalea sp.]|uniref:pyridoxamine 5'-phosphate oxidase family protein n=1 Tax=Maritalea sp. TaxID=2003361 RepID=UPI003EFB1DD1
MFKKLRRAIFCGLIEKYKARKRAGFQNTGDQALASAKRQLQRSRYAVLASNDPKAVSPDARLIEPIVDVQNFTFWIGTSPKSRKVKQVLANPNVTLVFSNQKDNSNLVVKGQAELVNDLPLRANYWKPYWRLFFPEGPQGDDYVLIKLVANEMEILDFSQNVVPEPFGLMPMKLVREDESWSVKS